METIQWYEDEGRLGYDTVMCPHTGRQEAALAFPHRKDGELVNITYCTFPHDSETPVFWSLRGREEAVFSGYDEVKGSGTDNIIIVDNDLMKLALHSLEKDDSFVGYRVLAVPAPALSSPQQQPQSPTEYGFVGNSADLFEDKGVLVAFATSDTEAGRLLAHEISRQIGRERCFQVLWPKGVSEHCVLLGHVRKCDPEAKEEDEDDEEAGCQEVEEEAKGGPAAVAVSKKLALPGEAGGQSDKIWLWEDGLGEPLAEEEGRRRDILDVLKLDRYNHIPGPGFSHFTLRTFIDMAEGWPLDGLVQFKSVFGEMKDEFMRAGQPLYNKGLTTGWARLDEFYLVTPGEVTLVTGVPNSGKSEWLDALAVNLAKEHGFRTVFCSMEKKTEDHARQLMEKWMGKPFFRARYAEGCERMTEAEVLEALEEVDKHFFIIRYDDDSLPSIDWVLERAKAAVLRYGVQGLVIDPYNELEHQRPRHVTETEYVKELMTKLRRFAQNHECHVWFVAHPRQLMNWQGEPPNLYDISGSAHFVNKADNGVVVHRHWPKEKTLTPEEDKKKKTKTRSHKQDDAKPDGEVDPLQVQILVRKVRNKLTGRIGACQLRYDRVSGRYVDNETLDELSGPPNNVEEGEDEEEAGVWDASETRSPPRAQGGSQSRVRDNLAVSWSAPSSGARISEGDDDDYEEYELQTARFDEIAELAEEGHFSPVEYGSLLY